MMSLCCLLLRSPPSPTLFPYTTLFRSPKFFNAYLSADNRVTLLDVIPADTVSLTGLMDVVRRVRAVVARDVRGLAGDRKSTRLNSSHANISYAVFCLKKKST